MLKRFNKIRIRVKKQPKSKTKCSGGNHESGCGRVPLSVATDDSKMTHFFKIHSGYLTLIGMGF